MIRPAWLIGAFVLASAVAVIWPSGAVHRRLAMPGAGPRFALPSINAVEVRAWLESAALRRPRRLIALTVVVPALVCGVWGGPVAALVGGVYGALAGRALARHAAKGRDTIVRARRLDELCALAADLRAGLPPAAMTRPQPHHAIHAEPQATVPAVSKQAIRDDLRIAELSTAVWRLAEHTGAPAADLVERIEADARATDRAKASAAAQAAGAQATAMLLAALPLGGIALGYGIGADPLRILLHTPLGAACATAAVSLQCAGLFWADRLANGPVR